MITLNQIKKLPGIVQNKYDGAQKKNDGDHF